MTANSVISSTEANAAAGAGAAIAFEADAAIDMTLLEDIEQQETRICACAIGLSQHGLR